MNWFLVLLALQHAGRDVSYLTPDPLIATANISVRPTDDEMGAWEVTEARWNAIEWSAFRIVSDYLGGRWAIDTVRLPGRKPTFARVQAEFDVYIRIHRKKQLRAECRRRIIAAYGAKDWQDEMELRVRGGATVAQNTERDRLRAVYKAQAAGLAGAPVATVTGLEPYDDAVWQPSEED